MNYVLDIALPVEGVFKDHIVVVPQLEEQTSQLLLVHQQSQVSVHGRSVTEGGDSSLSRPPKSFGEARHPDTQDPIWRSGKKLLLRVRVRIGLAAPTCPAACPIATL